MEGYGEFGFLLSVLDYNLGMGSSLHCPCQGNRWILHFDRDHIQIIVPGDSRGLLANFSPKVRTHLLQRAQMGRLRLGGEKSVVSVLCADIRGFARLTAELPTDEVVPLLNEYFAALTDCIFRNDGTIDKFVGDAILAVFGSPEDDPQHCRKAVFAGMDMQAAAQQVSRRRKGKGEVSCEIGIGSHTGEVHGFIGSPERMEFTVIGDAVNRASPTAMGRKAARY